MFEFVNIIPENISGPLKAKRRSFRTITALMIAASLSGCAVGPDYETPTAEMLDIPSNWTDADTTNDGENALDLSEWWLRLQDDELTVIIEEAVANNLDVAAAKARIREARATFRQATPLRYPSLDGSASYTRSKTASGGAQAFGPFVGDPFNSYQAGLDASWELDLFGGNRREIEAARYGLDIAEEDLRATLLTLIGDVALNYVEARGFQARIDLASRTAKSQHETAALTHLKFRAGSTSAVDVANALGLASGTEAAVSLLEANYAASVHRLSVLTGRQPSALKEQLAAQKPIPTPLSIDIPVGIPADILRSRPDVRMAERQYAQYTARIGQAEAARYPSINLTGSINTSALQAGNIAKSSTIGWSFGPSLNLPLFNAGKLKAAVKIAEAQRDQYFIAYRQSVLTALEDIENALISFSKEQQRYLRLDASADAYRNAAQLSRSRYQYGTSNFLDVLDSERALYSAEDTLIQSRVAIITNYITLNKTLGGGWDGKIDVTTSVAEMTP